MHYVEELLAEALITAPGCPETLVERALRNAAGEFYRDSQAWRVTLDPAPVIVGQRIVDLDLPQYTHSVRVFWARLAGQPLKAISERNLSDRTGEPQGYALSGISRELRLDVLPARTYTRDGLEVHLAVAPTVELDELDDALFFSHRDGILYGAQRNLLLMPNVSWGNGNAAGAMAQLFEAAKFKARREAEAQQAAVVRTVRYGGL